MDYITWLLNVGIKVCAVVVFCWVMADIVRDEIRIRRPGRAKKGGRK